jgi:hypothetical protein
MGKAKKKQKGTTGPRKGDDPLPPEGRPASGVGVGFIRSYLTRSLEVFLYWMPVWVPLILLAQIGSLGLDPALEEEQRLLEQEQELFDRLAADEARARKLVDLHKALGDDIYHERLNRLNRDEARQEVETRSLGLRKPEPEPEGD